MKWIVLLLCSLGLSAQADTLNLEYSTFYSHLKKLDDEDLSALQFAFGFKHVTRGDLCHIESVKIHTQKVDLDIEPLNNQRFLLPTEKALKQANASVEIHLDDAANQCDMSVQLETKSDWLKPVYQKQDLALLLAQYQQFFDDMGGFLSFMMPSVTGVALHFDSPEAIREGNPELPWKDQIVELDENWIEQHSELALSAPPSRITAVTSK